jgi:hypothetical protein
MARVVAWHIAQDAATCDQCGEPATVDVVEEDGVTVRSLCNEHLEPGTPDPLAAVFARALAGRQRS